VKVSIVPTVFKSMSNLGIQTNIFCFKMHKSISGVVRYNYIITNN